MAMQVQQTNNRILIVALLCIIYTVQISSAVTVQLNENYTLSWELIGDDTIEFEAIVRTLGYIGFGISKSGGMAGADIVVAGVYPNGTGYISDRYATANGFPPEDTSQDYTLLDASENGTHTRVRVSRLRSTCDLQDNEITADTQKLIWSFGSADGVVYHGTTNRGTRNVNFMDPEMDQPDLSEFEVWRITSNLTMPSPKTTYWCTMQKTPPLTRKHHMVAFDAYFNGPEAKRHSHHIDVYKCEAPEGQDPDDLFGPWLNHTGVDCYFPEDPDFPVDHCEWIQYGWAIGGQITVFPNFTGFPFIGNQYYILEVHLDNPDELEGVEFETGMTIYYTDNVRPIDSAQFLVGSLINFTQMIPPNSVDFVNVAHCSPSCTSNFPEDGITVFNILLHSHFSGRKMKVRLWRNGVEMPWVINDDSYDFNYQQNRPVRPFKFYRGDHITTECTYDTTWKNGSSVIGGRATTEEMCMAFFFYYPRMPDLVECNSEMPVDELLNFLGVESVFQEEGEEDATVTAPEHLNGLKLTYVIENRFNWTTEARAEYQRKHRFEPHHGVCWPAFNDSVTTYPEADEYVPEDECANINGSSLPMFQYKFNVINTIIFVVLLLNLYFEI